jgi:hypothetical protein
MQRALSDDELSWGIVARNVVGVDVIRSFIVINWLKLEA